VQESIETRFQHVTVHHYSSMTLSTKTVSLAKHHVITATIWDALTA